MKKTPITIALYCVLFLSSVYNRKEETHLDREPAAAAMYAQNTDAITFSGGTTWANINRKYCIYY